MPHAHMRMIFYGHKIVVIASIEAIVNHTCALDTYQNAECLFVLRSKTGKRFFYCVLYFFAVVRTSWQICGNICCKFIDESSWPGSSNRNTPIRSPDYFGLIDMPL